MQKVVSPTAGTGMGSTRIFSYISWLGPFLVQNFEFQYFWKFPKKIFLFFGRGGGGGLEDFVDIFGVIVKLDYFEGFISMHFSSVLNIYGKSARLSFAWAFVTEPKPHVLAQMPVLYYLCEQRRKSMSSRLHICFVLSGPSSQMAIECHFVRAVKALASLHICTGLP